MSAKRRKIAVSVEKEVEVINISGDEKESDEDDSKMYQLGVVELVHAHIVGENDEFNEMDSLEQRRVRYLSSPSYYERPMTNLLRRRPVGNLQSFYAQHFSGIRKLSRRHMARAITKRFFQKETDLEKRSGENENIRMLKNDFDLQKELNFMVMKGIVIPCEIVRNILTFIDRTGESLFAVGSVCKCFYLQMLSTWDVLRVQQIHVYEISVLVLKNVRTVVFVERSSNRKLRLRKEEVWYLLDHIEPNKLRKIVFDTIYKQEVWNHIAEYFESKSSSSSKEKETFQNPLAYVHTLEFSTENSTRKRYPDVKRSKNMFPSLQTIIYPQSSSYFHSSDNIEIIRMNFVSRFNNRVEPGITIRYLPKTTKHVVLESCGHIDFDRSKTKFDVTLTQQQQQPQSFFGDLETATPKLQSLSLTDLKSKSTESFFRHFQVSQNLSSSLSTIQIVEVYTYLSYRKTDPIELHALSFSPFFTRIKKFILIGYRRMYGEGIPSFEKLFALHLPSCTHFVGGLGLRRTMMKQHDQNRNLSELNQFLVEEILRDGSFEHFDLRLRIVNSSFENTFTRKKKSERYDASYWDFYNMGLRGDHLKRIVKERERKREEERMEEKKDEEESEMDVFRFRYDKCKREVGVFCGNGEHGEHGEWMKKTERGKREIVVLWKEFKKLFCDVMSHNNEKKRMMIENVRRLIMAKNFVDGEQENDDDDEIVGSKESEVYVDWNRREIMEIVDELFGDIFNPDRHRYIIEGEKEVEGFQKRWMNERFDKNGIKKVYENLKT